MSKTTYEIAREALDALKEGEATDNLVEFFTQAVNGRLSRGDATKVGKSFRRVHRYLQSELIFFCLEIIRQMANQSFWDGRNESALNVALRVAELMEKDGAYEAPPRWLLKRVNQETYVTEWKNEGEWGPKYNAQVFTQHGKDNYASWRMQEEEEWEKLT